MALPTPTDRIEALYEAVPDGLFLIDPATSHILHCNRTACEQLGFAREELLGHSVLSLQKDVTGLPQWSQIADAIRHTQPYVFVGRHRHRDGHEISVEVHTVVVTLDGQERFLSSARDITRRRQLDQEMLDRQAHVQFALNEASDGIWDWNIANGDVFFSPQLKRMLGYGPHEMAPTLTTWSDNVHPDDRDRVFLAISQHIAGKRERYDTEYRLKNRNGHVLWVHDRGSVCERDDQGKPLRMVGMVQNITDQKTQEAHLMHLASRDSLTGLRNRRESELVTDTLLNTCLRLRVPLGVCLFDLDRFKDVNDRYGHLVGDQVLVRVAEAMQGAIRSSDALFRWGGEEFLLLAPGLGTPAMTQLADKLRMRLENLDWSDLLTDRGMTASFGVATLPEHGDKALALMLAADTALYEAKANGRNQVKAAPAQPITTLSDVALRRVTDSHLSA